MKNTNMKKLIRACVAVFAFIGVNNTTVEAKIDYRVVKEDTLQELGIGNYLIHVFLIQILYIAIDNRYFLSDSHKLVPSMAVAPPNILKNSSNVLLT